MTPQTQLFPKSPFWNFNAPQVTLVNPEDVIGNNVFKKLGLLNLTPEKSPTADINEIRLRQMTLKYLMHPRNKGLRKFLSNFHPTNFDSVCQSGQNFINHMNGNVNLLWAQLKELRQTFSDVEIPSEIKDLLSKFDGTQESAQEEESKLFESVSAGLDKATLFEGVMTFKVSISEEGIDSTCKKVVGAGYRLYHSRKVSDNEDLASVPSWCHAELCKLVGIKRLAQWIVDKENERIEQVNFSPYTFKEIPKEILECTNQFIGTVRKRLGSKIHKNFSGSFTVEVALKYEKKLTLNIISVKSTDVPHFSPMDTTADFKGFSPFQKRKLRAAQSKLQERCGKQLDVFELLKMPGLNKRDLQWLLSEHVCPSKGIDSKYKHLSIMHLLKEGENKSRHARVAKYRNSLLGCLQNLKFVASIADQMLKLEKDFGNKAVFPNILEDTHSLSFNSLLPVHLGSDVKLVPIVGLPTIKSEIIALSGQNAGGKTVTQETIINMLLLAQTGLPIFGENIAFNPRGVIAAISVDRGEGSLMERQARKIMAMFESLQKVDIKHAIVLIDELGAGTQETEGRAFGMRVLNKLHELKVGVVFSSQITTLIEQAEKELDARCFKFNLKHVMTSGIGRGNPDAVVKKIGLDEYLEERKSA